MKITNPTQLAIGIQHRGTVYTIPAMGAIFGIAEEVAEYWKTMIHSFIIVEADVAEVTEVKVVAPKVETTVVEEVESVEQEEEEEEVKEEVKKPQVKK